MKTLSKFVLYATAIALLSGSLLVASPALAENSLFSGVGNPAPEMLREEAFAENSRAPQEASVSQGSPLLSKKAVLAASLVNLEKDRSQAPSAIDPNRPELVAASLDSMGNEPTLRAVEAIAVEKAIAEAVIAKAAAERAAAFASKIESMTNGNAGQLTGLYVQNSFAMSAGDFWQFGLAAQHGSLGLMAHNYAGGGNYFSLSVGSVINLVYGDGSIRKFQVTKVRRFEALQPNSPTSDFIDLDNGGGKQSVTKVFNAIYNSSNPLVLQTCIANHGVSTWGRLFVIAVPIS
jgi:hypothetical protein